MRLSAEALMYPWCRTRGWTRGKVEIPSFEGRLHGTAMGLPVSRRRLPVQRRWTSVAPDFKGEGRNREVRWRAFAGQTPSSERGGMGMTSVRDSHLKQVSGVSMETLRIRGRRQVPGRDSPELGELACWLPHCLGREAHFQVYPGRRVAAVRALLLSQGGLDHRSAIIPR